MGEKGLKIATRDMIGILPQLSRDGDESLSELAPHGPAVRAALPFSANFNEAASLSFVGPVQVAAAPIVRRIGA